MNPKAKLAKARQKVLKLLEFAEPFVESVRTVFTDRINPPTMAMSKNLTMLVHPQWVADRSIDELAADLIHEYSHVWNEHFTRGEGKDGKKWNLAGDAAINPPILAMGLPMHKPVVPSAWSLPDFKTAEFYYDHMPKQEGGGNGHGKKCGSAAGNEDAEQLEQEIEQELRDDGVHVWSPAEVETIIEKVQKDFVDSPIYGTKAGNALMPDVAPEKWAAKKIPWEKLFKRWLNSMVLSSGGAQDYSKRRKSRRSFTRGIIIPGLVSYEPNIYIAIDTSGSMAPLIPRILAVVEDVMRSCGIRHVQVLQADAAVQSVDTVHLSRLANLRFKGFGGTDFRPVFEYIGKKMKKPELVLFITDTYGSFPDRAPAYPVFWAITTPYGRVPWGHSVNLDMS